MILFRPGTPLELYTGLRIAPVAATCHGQEVSVSDCRQLS